MITLTKKKEWLPKAMSLRGRKPVAISWYTVADRTILKEIATPSARNDTVAFAWFFWISRDSIRGGRQGIML